MLDQKETKENLRAGFAVDRKPYTDDYDYDADSDLEEDEDWDSSDAEDSRVVLEKGKSNQSDSGTLVDSQNSDAKDDESSDIISVSDMDSLLSDSVDTKAKAEVAATPTPTHIGTVAVIDDVAFVTWVCSSFSQCGLSDLLRQVPGTTSLLVHKRDRICTMGIRGKTEGTRSGGNCRTVRNTKAITEIHLPAG